MRANKLRRARLVKRVEERFLALRRYGCQFAEQENLAERGRCSKRIDGRLAQSREPASDRFLDALWNRQLMRFLALPPLTLAINLSLLDERLDDLFDEKGIAFGLAVKRHREVVRYARLSEQRREQGAGIRKGQASKR